MIFKGVQKYPSIYRQGGCAGVAGFWQVAYSFQFVNGARQCFGWPEDEFVQMPSWHFLGWWCLESWFRQAGWFFCGSIRFSMLVNCLRSIFSKWPCPSCFSRRHIHFWYSCRIDYGRSHSRIFWVTAVLFEVGFVFLAVQFWFRKQTSDSDYERILFYGCIISNKRIPSNGDIGGMQCVGHCTYQWNVEQHCRHLF